MNFQFPSQFFHQILPIHGYVMKLLSLTARHYVLVIVRSTTNSDSKKIILLWSIPVYPSHDRQVLATRYVWTQPATRTLDRSDFHTENPREESSRYRTSQQRQTPCRQICRLSSTILIVEQSAGYNDHRGYHKFHECKKIHHKLQMDEISGLQKLSEQDGWLSSITMTLEFLGLKKMLLWSATATTRMTRPKDNTIDCRRIEEALTRMTMPKGKIIDCRLICTSWLTSVGNTIFCRQGGFPIVDGYGRYHLRNKDRLEMFPNSVHGRLVSYFSQQYCTVNLQGPVYSKSQSVKSIEDEKRKEKRNPEITGIRFSSCNLSRAIALLETPWETRQTCFHHTDVSNTGVYELY
jgi:hypothetical protein